MHSRDPTTRDASSPATELVPHAIALLLLAITTLRAQVLTQGIALLVLLALLDSTEQAARELAQGLARVVLPGTFLANITALLAVALIRDKCVIAAQAIALLFNTLLIALETVQALAPIAAAAP